MFPRKASDHAKSGGSVLPKEFYTRPDLTQPESDFLGSIATNMCMEVIIYAQENGGSVKWKHKNSSRDGVQIFQGEEFGGNEDLTYVCGVNTIRGALADVADLFHLTNDDKLASYARVFEPDLIDMFTIHDIVKPSLENPLHYIGVRWSAVESSSPLVKNRDFCYLECQDEFVDTRTNKQGWVRCIHSINIPSCPSLEKTLGFVRGSYYRSGFVVLETDKPGILEITHVLQVNFKGSVPAWWRQQTLRRRVASIGRIDKFLQGKKLSAGHILGDIDLPPKKHVVHCHLCCRRFDLVFTRRFRCRKCAHVICKHCSDHWYLHLPVSGDKRVRICSLCAASTLDKSALSSVDDHQSPNIQRNPSAAAPPLQPPHRRPKSTPNLCPPSIHVEPQCGRSLSNDSYLDSQTNHYSYDDMDDADSFQDSSVYETNPFEKQLQLGQNMTQNIIPTISTTDQGESPTLEHRMRPRDDLNDSYLESVRSIHIGRHNHNASTTTSPTSPGNATDWFNARLFGQADVNLDPLDRQWGNAFTSYGQQTSYDQHQPKYTNKDAGNETSSFGSVDSDRSSSSSAESSSGGFRYSLQVPHQ
ncbi:hypothetical protein H257_16861 [Aphanomyces astaci]|uniref:FYVE-type domain-containing protein n=2 Tax=Aphanomyces astaci TaxID=112090 RepID=W4FIW6_APHAT|nr:hypothetical protein H257_16861 [Aphanomyces astaci]ETV66776.1 hypothetical protein H257_16861 [Aphanomyces astaci]|eukprot:XP_009843752.1 hypothetical protein H257_16861 [Aphanomyces astaci]